MDLIDAPAVLRGTAVRIPARPCAEEAHEGQPDDNLHLSGEKEEYPSFFLRTLTIIVLFLTLSLSDF